MTLQQMLNIIFIDILLYIGCFFYLTYGLHFRRFPFWGIPE